MRTCCKLRLGLVCQVGHEYGLLLSLDLHPLVSAQVVIASSNPDRLNAAVKLVGHGATGIQTDATDDEQVD